MKFKTGTKIKWQYTHHLNDRSSTEIVKIGKFIDKIKHRIGYQGIPLALVKFNGNKNCSRVPLNELTL